MFIQGLKGVDKRSRVRLTIKWQWTIKE